MHRLLPVVLGAAFLLPVVGVQADAAIDLSGPIPAGDFRAWRLLVTGDGTIDLGLDYSHLTSSQPVVPVLQVAMKEGAPYSWGASFAMDDGSEPTVVVRAGGVEQRVGAYTIGESSLSTYDVGAGEYLFVLATGPADGDAQMTMRVNAPGAVLASQAGKAFWARGLDLSDTAVEAFTHGNSDYARAWRYSGADAAFPVEGHAFGYIGYHGASAAWVNPDGQRLGGFIVDGAPGAWSASFPAEQFLGPVCVTPCFLNGFDSREDPPFAVAADVTI
jgi:hypothetical protein